MGPPGSLLAGGRLGGGRGPPWNQPPPPSSWGVMAACPGLEGGQTAPRVSRVQTSGRAALDPLDPARRWGKEGRSCAGRARCGPPGHCPYTGKLTAQGEHWESLPLTSLYACGRLAMLVTQQGADYPKQLHR